MTLDELPRGCRVLLDANIVVYHAANASEACSRLLERAERGELRLAMAAPSFAEMLHRLMISEARSRGLILGGNPARKLADSPEVVKALSDYLKVESVLVGCGLEFLDLTRAVMAASHAFRHRYGLLVNDSLVAATAGIHEIGAVATADLSFTRVKEFETYLPGDLG